MNPELIAVLKIELKGPLGNKDVNVNTNPVLQIAIYGPETNSNNADVDREVEGASIDVSRDLFLSLTQNPKFGECSIVEIGTLVWKGEVEVP